MPSEKVPVKIASYADREKKNGVVKLALVDSLADLIKKGKTFLSRIEFFALHYLSLRFPFSLFQVLI